MCLLDLGGFTVKFSVSLLTFCLIVVFIIESGVLKSPTVIINYFSFQNVLLHIF